MGRLRAQAIVIKDDQILLLKTRIGDREDYELPGGGIEEGETPEDAAIRELFEETGIKGEVVRLAFKYYNGFGVQKSAIHAKKIKQFNINKYLLTYIGNRRNIILICSKWSILILYYGGYICLK